MNFLHPTLQLAFLNVFKLSTSSASFLPHLVDSTAGYQEESVLEVLPRRLRGPVITCFEDQPEFSSLDYFKSP